MDAIPIYKLFNSYQWELELLKLARPNAKIYRLEAERGPLETPEDDEAQAFEAFYASYRGNTLEKLQADPVTTEIIKNLLSQNAKPMREIFRAILKQVTEHFTAFRRTDTLSRFSRVTLRQVLQTVLSAEEHHHFELSLERMVQGISSILLLNDLPEIGWSKRESSTFFIELNDQYCRLKKSCLPMVEYKALPEWEKEQAFLELDRNNFPCWETAQARLRLILEDKESYLRNKAPIRALNANHGANLYEINNKWIENIITDFNQNLSMLSASSLAKITHVDQSPEYGGPPPYATCDLWQAVINNPIAFQINLPVFTSALEKPILDGFFDDWDLLQAAWELATEENLPLAQAQTTIQSVFPAGQPKLEQIACLEEKLKFIYEIDKGKSKPLTPTDILEQAVNKVAKLPPWMTSTVPLRNGENHYTPRFFWKDFREYKMYEMNEKGEYATVTKGYRFFGTDLWLFLAKKKNSGQNWIKLQARENLPLLDINQKDKASPITQDEKAALLGLYKTGSKNHTVLKEFILNFNNPVRYAELQDGVWKRPGKNLRRPFQNAEKAASDIDKDIKIAGFILDPWGADSKTVGRKMIRL